MMKKKCQTNAEHANDALFCVTDVTYSPGETEQKPQPDHPTHMNAMKSAPHPCEHFI